MTRLSQRLGPDVHVRVQDRVRHALADDGLDAVLTCHPEDVAHLTGFFHHPGERPVAVWLPVTGDALLLVPDLEREHAVHQEAQAHVVAYDEYPGTRPPFASLARALGSVALRRQRVGRPGSTTLEHAGAAERALPSAVWTTSRVLERVRALKEPEELVLHAEAARITDLMLGAGVAAVTDAAEAGAALPTETELAALVSAAGVAVVRDEHDDVVPTGFVAGGLVYAGENSARPHALPTGRRLCAGDTFMLSLGCAVGGRYAEGERTYVLGEPTAQQRRLHAAVERAQAAGARALHPGTPCSAADRTCRDVLREAGLGQHVRHRQGHGIGLGMHEPPWLESGDPTPLAAGMVVSNEPGVYVPGHAGYRISDTVELTATGSRSLTSHPCGLDDCTVAL